MRIRLTATAMMAAALLAITATPSLANTFFQKAPGDAAQPAAGTADTACVVPAGPGGPYASKYVHCHDPAAIRSWYGVDQLPNKGDGQTIVLVDSYGTPTGAHDLQVFHDRFFPNEPNPNYDRGLQEQLQELQLLRRQRPVRPGGRGGLGRRGDARHRVGLRDRAPRAHRAARRAPGRDAGRAGLPEPVQGDQRRDRRLPRRAPCSRRASA